MNGLKDEAFIKTCQRDLSVRWFFRSFKKCDNYFMAVKPVPLESGGFRLGLNLYE
jgi:hypothetical protein